MARLLRLPAEWGGSVRCTPEAFGHVAPTVTPWKVLEPAVDWFDPPPAPRAHLAAWPTTHDAAGAGKRQHRLPQAPAYVPTLPSCPDNAFGRTHVWADIVAPYCNVSASDRQVAQILADCTRKLNGLDPELGLGVLHGMLSVNDDVGLCKTFLELGVNPETCYIRSAATFDNPPSDDLYADDRYGFHGRSGREQQHQQNAIPDQDEDDAKLNHGTALHFAAFYGRKNCLSALIDAGADLTAARTFSGRSVLDLARDASVKDLLDKAVRDGPVSLAQLARDGKYFAIRHRMRAGKVTAADLNATCDGKTAVEFIWAKMCEWNFAMDFHEDSLAPFKIMIEMKFRYGSVPHKFGKPPLVAHFLGGDNGASAPGGADGILETSVEKILSNQSAILESLYVLSTELKNKKETVEDDA